MAFVVDCVVFVHYTKDLVDYTTEWSGISRNGGSTCRTCTVLYCIDVVRPLANGTQKRCTEINHEILWACRVLYSSSEQHLKPVTVLESCGYWAFGKWHQCLLWIFSLY